MLTRKTTWCAMLVLMFMLLLLSSKFSSIVWSLKALLAKTLYQAEFCLYIHTLKPNIFHLSSPYLPICGIPLPLLKYIIYVLSLDVQNLLFCATDSAHEEVVGNP